MSSLGNRIVVLIDMDCFFCQVETKLQPQHAGKPLAVVQYNQWEMGGIIAVNYEARSFGVTRHMRGKEAKEKCPDIVLASVPCLRGKADTTRYRKAGREVINVIRKYCNVTERASVDEAYLDVTDTVDKRLTMTEISPNKLILSLANTYIVGYSEVGENDEEKRSQGLKTWVLNSFKELQDTRAQRLAVAGVIVEEIRANIYKETGYRCSAGISQNKVLAKLACGLHKPNCQTILPEAAVSSLYSTLSVKKVRNLGGKFGDAVVESLGCKVMGDLLQHSLEQLQKHFDEKTGLWLYNIARGIDNEPVINRLLSKSVGACKKFPGKQAITSLDVLKHWAGDLAAEVCERLEEDLVENQRRATLLTVSYHYYQNRTTVSQTRSLTLNSYKPEKMASQCVDVITKSTQCPVAFVGISAGKFVPSKESSTFLKFFTTIKTEDNDEAECKIDISGTVNSSEDISKFNLNCEMEDEKLNAFIDNKENPFSKNAEKSFATVADKDSSLKSDKEEPLAVVTNDNKNSFQNTESVTIEESVVNSETVETKSKRIVDISLNKNAEDSPTSRRVFKLMEVCNERDGIKLKNKRMSNVGINKKDFQSSFFMNIYKTEKNCPDDISSDTIEEPEHAERSVIPSNAKDLDVDNKNTDDDNSESYMRKSSRENPSTSRAHMRVHSNDEDSANETTSSVRNPAVLLREIFPNLDDIDPDILLLLPPDLQEEARSCAKLRAKKQENVKVVRALPKTTRVKSGKSKVTEKSKKRSPLLYNFLIKTDSKDCDMPLQRCTECGQMIPVARYAEHADFHVAQNLYQEINKPTAGENSVKRKSGDTEIVVSSAKRQPNICKLDG